MNGDSLAGSDLPLPLSSPLRTFFSCNVTSLVATSLLLSEIFSVDAVVAGADVGRVLRLAGDCRKRMLLTPASDLLRSWHLPVLIFRCDSK